MQIVVSQPGGPRKPNGENKKDKAAEKATKARKGRSLFKNKRGGLDPNSAVNSVQNSVEAEPRDTEATADFFSDMPAGSTVPVAPLVAEATDAEVSALFTPPAPEADGSDAGSEAEGDVGHTVPLFDPFAEPAAEEQPPTIPFPSTVEAQEAEPQKASATPVEEATQVADSIELPAPAEVEVPTEVVVPAEAEKPAFVEHKRPKFGHKASAKDVVAGSPDDGEEDDGDGEEEDAGKKASAKKAKASKKDKPKLSRAERKALKKQERELATVGLPDVEDDVEGSEDEEPAEKGSAVNFLVSLLELCGAGAACFFIGTKVGGALFNQVISAILGG